MRSSFFLHHVTDGDNSAGANPIKNLLVEIHQILQVYHTSKFYGLHFTHISQATCMRNIAKSVL